MSSSSSSPQSPVLGRWALDRLVSVPGCAFTLHEGHDAEDPARRALVASTPAHVEPLAVIEARLRALSPAGVIAVAREGERDVLVEARPPGQPSTAIPLDENNAWALIEAVGRALEALHARGLALGALRPELVFVDDAGRWTGWSPLSELFFRSVAPSERARYPHDHVYIAPEVLDGSAFDARADWFCLAACAARWLTGRYPFPGASYVLRSVAILRGALAPAVAAALPPSLRAALSADPADRGHAVPRRAPCTRRPPARSAACTRR
jgi:hypothetical protein